MLSKPTIPNEIVLPLQRDIAVKFFKFKNLTRGVTQNIRKKVNEGRYRRIIAEIRENLVHYRFYSTLHQYRNILGNIH